MTQPSPDHKTILLAEDDASMRGFLEKILTQKGYIVTACEDGAQAYESLQRQEFDLLLTDIVMPNMDGIELTQRALSLYPTIKTLYITGFTASETSINSTQTTDRIDNVITKPFHMNDLVEKISKTLEKPS